MTYDKLVREHAELKQTNNEQYRSMFDALAEANQENAELKARAQGEWLESDELDSLRNFLGDMSIKSPVGRVIGNYERLERENAERGRLLRDVVERSHGPYGGEGASSRTSVDTEAIEAIEAARKHLDLSAEK